MKKEVRGAQSSKYLILPGFAAFPRQAGACSQYPGLALEEQKRFEQKSEERIFREKERQGEKVSAFLSLFLNVQG